MGRGSIVIAVEPDHDDPTGVDPPAREGDATAARSPASLGPAEDSTERKRSEAQTLSADRMASMGMLAAAVVHELNNPLGVTIANVSFALEELRAMQANLVTDDTEGTIEMAARLARARAHIVAIVDALGEARQGGDRARLIVRDLRTFSRADDERHQPIDVRRVLESSINMAYREIRHRARLVKDYGPIPLVSGNEARLGQVFLNLLVNAAQAIREGDVEHHCIRVVTRTDERGRCVVEVSDSGRGITVEDLPRVFEPFFTTKQRTSTGLGLSICQNVVTAMGGEIAAESGPGEGSTFRVTLPSAAQHTPVPASAPASIRAPAPRRRVLVVDDEPMMARAVQRLLEGEHDVLITSDPLGAVEQIRAGARFDAILCDLMMPTLSGMDVYEAISRVERDQARRMVFMTGGAFTPRAVRFLETISNPRIEKPLEYAALRAVLRTHLADRGGK
jgi:signal transduction histidine kinase/CheY-like chemotaxis protein